MYRLLLAALLLVHTLPATADTLQRWRRVDATGLEAWAALQAAMPDLAQDVAQARFVPSRGLRQIAIDLDHDRREEILLHVDRPAWCNRDGCLVAVMSRSRDGSWRPICTTRARVGERVLFHSLRRIDSGWRRVDTSARITFRRDGAGRVVCDETPLP